MARKDVINTDGSIKWDTIGQIHDDVNDHTTQLAEISINVKSFGAKCDWNGTTGTDDTQALKNAIAHLRLLNGGKILIPGLCRLTDNIILDVANIELVGQNTLHDGSVPDNKSGLILDHFIDGIVLNKKGIKISGLWVTRTKIVGDDVKDIHVNTSYSKITDCNVNPHGGIGVYYDGALSCYFNEMNHTIVNGTGKMVVYSGANCTVNRIYGGAIASATLGKGGLYVENSSEQNTFYSVNFEGGLNSTAITLLSGGNTFIACHIEENLVGVHLGAGNNTFINSPIVAHEGQTEITGTWKYATKFLQKANVDGEYETFLSVPGFKLGFDGISYMDNEPKISTEANGYRLFSRTPTTGIKYLELYKYNGSTYDKVWGVTDSPESGLFIESLGNIKLIKCTVSPEGYSYAASEPGSLVYRRGYGDKYAFSSYFGELYLKTKNTDNTGYKEIQAIHSGTTAQRLLRPSSVGFQYFDTDLGKPIWVKSLNPTVWVDSNGIVV